jgi:hypothetical protein
MQENHAMTARQSSRDTDPAPTPTRRDVYRETVVDATSAPLADAAAREVYQERVSGPAGDQVLRSEHASVPSAAARRGADATRAKQVIYFIFGGYEGVRQGPVHFAGEHCSVRFQGFMEGAAREGARAAREIVQDWGGKERMSEQGRDSSSDLMKLS